MDKSGQHVTKPTGFNIGTFRALSILNYRYIWLGALGTSAASWMEQVVRPLLMLELTGSALQVGLVVSIRMIPQLVFGLLAGVVADRYNKRLILIISQTITLLMQLALALLLLTGNLAIWHIYVTAFISGASWAFDLPSRQSLVPRVVPKDMLLNAFALNNASMNIMRVLGASLAGVLLIFFNYGEIYLVSTVILAVVVWSSLMIKVSEDDKGSSSDKAVAKNVSLLSDLVAGFRYVARTPILFYLVGLGMILFILVQPYQQVFIPLFALDVLDIGKSGAGWLLSFCGVGAIIGGLSIASLKKVRRRGLILLFFLALLGASLLLFAQSQWIVLSCFALMIAGFSTAAFNSLNISLLFEQSSKEYHGRVISLMSLDRGMVSVGAAVAGFLAEGLGPQPALTIIAITSIGLTVLIFLIVRPLRKLV